MAASVLVYADGAWHEGNPQIIGPMTHGFWMSSVVFDGARAFEGVTPDLDLHCQRVIRSAEVLGLRSPVSAEEIIALAREGVKRFPVETALYIRPILYAESGFVAPDPASTRFVLCVVDTPLPPPKGDSACLSTRRRPSPESAPTLAKAACLYPQGQMAIREASRRGFENAILLDPNGNVTELATANLFIAKDGAVHTPVPNGTFLNGITRQRVVRLLQADGVEVQERTITPQEVLAADEVFSTGNYGKVLPFARIEDRTLAPGPFYQRARRLYWEFAHAAG